MVLNIKEVRQWLDRKVSKTSFRDQIDSLTLAELEKQYGDVIRATADTVYIGSGFDGRYAGLKVSPEEADYIRSRYALLKAQGQMSLYHKEMFDNLRDKDKDEIDKLDIFELTSSYPYLILGRRSSFEFGSDGDYAKKNYLYYRFEELMAKEPIDWRDPQFMEKLNAHINETGINPITGKPATEAEITTAKLYTSVKVASNILAIVALLKGPKVVNKYYSEKVSKGITQTVSVSAEKFSVERLEDRAKKIRAELPTSKLQNRGNIAVADVQIEGLKEEFVAHSKIHSSQSQGASIADFSFSDKKRIFESYVEDRFPRYNDTEAKILEDIASQIKDKDISGTINLYTELPPCQSCSNIIEEFQEMFPNVEINVFFNQD